MTDGKPLRVLVAGRQGQLARCLADLARPGLSIIAAGRPEMDIADASSVARTMASVRPDVVINAAAYTAVDKAEDDAAAASRVNETGAGILAAAATRAGVPIIHISTDYVFSGDKQLPYVETDVCAPLGIYGRTKLAGEVAVRAATGNHLILRTAWVYSEHGANFLKTMLRLAKDKPLVSVVADQWGCPTYAGDLAEAILIACAQAVVRGRDVAGTYHLVARGATTWADFAAEIYRQSAARGGPCAQVVPITTAQYPTRATRPSYSVLDTTSFTARFDHHLPIWDAAIARCLTRLGAGF